MNTTLVCFKQDGDGHALVAEAQVISGKVSAVANVRANIKVEFTDPSDKAIWDAGRAHATVMAVPGAKILLKTVKVGTSVFLPDDFRHTTFEQMLNHLVCAEPIIDEKEGYYPVHKVYRVLLGRVDKTGAWRVNGRACQAAFNGLTPLADPRNGGTATSFPPVTSPPKATKPKVASKPKWLKPKPASDEFYVEDSVWEAVCYAMAHGTNLLFTGPSGTGKSELVWRAASALGKTVEVFNMGAMSEPRSALIGTMHLGEKGTQFVESRFVPAVQSADTVILLDELTRTTRGASNLLLPLLDDQRYLSLDEAESPRIIERHEKNCVCATANIGMEYTGTDALDKAMKDRFSTGLIELFFPPKDQEAAILEKRAGVDRAMAVRLASFGKTQRTAVLEKEEYTEFVSTRMLLKAAQQIANGVKPETALRYCVLTHFSADGGNSSERAMLGKLIAMTTKISLVV